MGGLSPDRDHRVVRLREMVLEAQIGVYAHEHGRAQRVRVDLELLVAAPAGGPMRDELGEVVDYAEAARLVRATVDAGHVRLVETLAERIARACLFDARIEVVVVRVEKLDALPDVASVGVEIRRCRSDLSTAPD